MSDVTIITPTGCIGNRGIDRDILAKVIDREQPDAIAVDAGSVDCGPWYLGAGMAHSPQRNIDWDLSVILELAVPKGIPVIIGSAGGSGAKEHVESAANSIQRIARSKGLNFRMATIHSDIEADFLLSRSDGDVIADGARSPDGAPLKRSAVENSETIVGLMGVGPMIEALGEGADVVVAGRAVDAAVVASYPIYRGKPYGLSYHMGDIMECAESCAEEIAPTLRARGRNRIPIIGRLGDDSFYLKPGLDTLACTPESCLMHSAYERVDLGSIKVPEGTVDRSQARYERVDQNSTRISGSRFQEEPHSILFEGVRQVGFRSIFPFGVRTPRMIEQLPQILSEVEAIERELFGAEGDFEIHWHRYGQSAVLRAAEPETHAHEVGVLADVVASTQDLAHDVAYDLLTRIAFWRYPGRYTTAGNIAVTLSPAVFDGGPVYEFSIYHSVPVADYRALFKTDLIEVKS